MARDNCFIRVVDDDLFNPHVLIRLTPSQARRALPQIEAIMRIIERDPAYTLYDIRALAEKTL